jgi:hypothetical protein
MLPQIQRKNPDENTSLRSRFISLIILFGLSVALHSGSPFIQMMGGSDTDYGSAMVQPEEDRILVAGWTASFGAGGNDALVSMFDTSGTHLWTKTFGGILDDYGLWVTRTGDGGFVMTGRTSSYGAGNNDAFLSRFDSSFGHLWTVTLGGSGEDYGVSVIETQGGDLVLTGYTTSTGQGSWDILLAKFDDLGTHLWTRVFGGTGDDRSLSLIETEDGGYLLTGRSSSFGAGANDAFLSKFDAAGTHQWSRSVGGTGHDYGYSVATGISGDIYVAGYTSSYGSGAGGWDISFSRFTSSGTHLWTRTFGGTGNEYTRSMTGTQDGGFAIVGYTSTFSQGGQDVLLSKFDDTGAHLWTWTLGDSLNDYGRAVATLGDSSLMVSGGIQSYGATGTDLILARFDSEGHSCIGAAASPSVQDWSPIVTAFSPTIIDTALSMQTVQPTVMTQEPTLSTICAGLCGDANGVGGISSADGFYILNYLGAGSPPVSCWAANVGGGFSITSADGFYLLNYLGDPGSFPLNCAPCDL